MDSNKPTSPFKQNPPKPDHSYVLLMEAFAAKLFATISSVKSSYAQLQSAQFPYNSDAIQSADESLVQQLNQISQLKQTYLNQNIHFNSTPPQITILSSEIQEQINMMNMYQLTLKKLHCQILSLKKEITEMRLSSSVLDGIKLPNSNPSDFVIVLQYAVKSVRCFVKQMVREMESANWNINSAAKSIVAGVHFRKPNHRCFAFESFIFREMLDGFGFNSIKNAICCEQFMRLKSAKNPVRFLNQNPNSSFGEFTKEKYLHLIHPKMEKSFFDNLTHRKMINSGEYPETAFFNSFAEMAKWVWLLHCFSLLLDQQVCIFQVKRGSRFSEMYMEIVTDEGGGGGGDIRVAFMVVPGFKVGGIMIQSQVYVSPVKG